MQPPPHTHTPLLKYSGGPQGHVEIIFENQGFSIQDMEGTLKI